MPSDTPLDTLAGYAHRRHAIAQFHDEAKSELGWDQYQGRLWLGFHRHAVTPYDGMRLRGRVRMTVLAGELIYEDGKLRRAARGRLLLRAVGADEGRVATEGRPAVETR